MSLKVGDVFEVPYGNGTEGSWIMVALKPSNGTYYTWDFLVLDDPVDEEEGLIMPWPSSDLRKMKRLG